MANWYKVDGYTLPIFVKFDNHSTCHSISVSISQKDLKKICPISNRKDVLFGGEKYTTCYSDCKVGERNNITSLERNQTCCVGVYGKRGVCEPGGQFFKQWAGHAYIWAYEENERSEVLSSGCQWGRVTTVQFGV